ncbi:hypothetical protein FPV67DRAFT_610758 [Lyophyllum atratum]|nr:hypothetical protein FPV67DRAFT_610758 [Lyophyllum atratum]
MTAILPPKIYLEIIKAACSDDGATGRALSLVSRCFWDLSRKYKLRSVAPVGARQLQDFANHLVNLPPDARHVRYLFVSIVKDITPSERKSLSRFFKPEKREFWEHEGHTSIAFLRICNTSHSHSTPCTLSLTSPGPCCWFPCPFLDCPV